MCSKCETNSMYFSLTWYGLKRIKNSSKEGKEKKYYLFAYCW
jgi:hypothetical protein